MTEASKFRSYKTRELGAVLLATSTIFLVLGYVSRYVMFEVASLIFMLLGVVLLFIEIEPHMGRYSARAVMSVMNTISQFVKSLGVEQKPFYIPSKSSQRFVMMLFPKEGLEPDGFVGPDEGAGFSSRGLSLTPLGRGLFQLYDEHLKLNDKDLEFVLDWLPRIVVEELHLAEGLTMRIDGDEIVVEADRPAFQSLCEEGIYREVGCPFCSSIAETIAYVTGRIVDRISCRYTGGRSQIRYCLGREVVNKGPG